MEKHFVRFMSPGTFVAEQTVEAIGSWNVETAVEMARGIVERYNATPYAFQFLTKSRGPNDLDSHVARESCIYHLGGDILTLDQVKARNDPSDEILIDNMTGNGWDRVVENRNSWRSVQPLRGGDVVLDFHPEPA